MRVIVFVKATPESETQSYAPGEMEKMFTEMGNYNEELVKAGVMLAGEGLLPSAQGKRVRFSGASRTVVDGPFTEAKELVAGYWIWRVQSMDEAVGWAKKCPNPTGQEGELEIRQIGEMEDMGAELTPELRAQEERLRAETEKLAKKKG
ncbi:MAG: YciI family protein [Vicinamibacteria bacterium]